MAGTPAGPGEPLESNRATSAGGDRGEAPPDERTEEQIDEPAEEQIAEPAEEQPDAPTEEQIDERPEEVPAAPLQFEAPPSIAPVFVNVRRGFEASGGDTLMAVGPTLEPLGESSHVARAVAGLAALGLPRFIGEGTGLVRIGGGRGLWVFAELDTIAFGIALTFALVYTARSVRSWRVLLASPLFVLLALVFLMLLSMGYSVVNFGTLFRLRLMLYAVLLMLPLGLRVGAEGSEGAADRAGDVDQV